MKEYVIRVAIPTTYIIKANSEDEAVESLRATLQPNLQYAARFEVVKESLFDEDTQTFYIKEEEENVV